MFPLGQKAKQLLRLHALLQGSAEPLGPVAMSPLTNSACPWTLVAQQRADVNVFITDVEFSMESELLLKVSRRSFG